MITPLSTEALADLVLRSPHLAMLVGKKQAAEVSRSLAKNPGLTAEDLTDSSDDLLSLIIDDRFLSFRIVSDDEGGSESGPWHSDVYGFASVWVASSIDYSNEWFLDREDAVSVAYDRAHDVIITSTDEPEKNFQKRFDRKLITSSEIRAST